MTRRNHDRDRGQGGRRRVPVCFVAWGAVSGRSREIAEALGGESRCVFPPEASWRPHASIRYVLSSVDTAVWLLRRRPASILVTNPPLLAGLVALACGRLIGARVVLDSHPGAFGAQGDTFSARLQHLNRWLVRHADGCAVASGVWVDVVRQWGGTAVEVHEAPGRLQTSPPTRDASRPLRVLCVGRLAPDEPTDAVIAAAATLPDCEFLVTGDTGRAPELVRVATPNVTFTGFLGPDAYRGAVDDADALMTLTTEPSSVQRAAYEAVYARRPLVVSDWPLNRELFPHAVHVANDTAGIVAGIERLRDHLAEYDGVTGEAQDLQLRRWEHQLDELREMLGLAPAGGHDADGSRAGEGAS